jgi:hypothetical protein
MTRTWNGRVRPLAGLAAAVLMILALMFAGMTPALADPGNGKGNDSSTAAAEDGHADKKTEKTDSGKSDHSKGNASTTGSYDEPQPQSTADQNTGGANGKCTGTDNGPYCSTRDGSPSGNGNGGGQAKGKPCAGCVGKADNKNPKGQYPGPSDRNNGYECDGNHGIARSNPAHTGCTDSASDVPPTTGGDTPQKPETPGDTCPANPPMAAGPTPCVPPSTGGDTPQKPETPADTCASDPSMPAGWDECKPCPTDATMPADDESCGSVVVVGPSEARSPEVKGVEAFAPGKARVAPVQATVAPAAGSILPVGLLPNTGAGAALVLLLVGGLVLVGVGATTLVARRKGARL